MAMVTFISLSGFPIALDRSYKCRLDGIFILYFDWFTLQLAQPI